MAKKRKISKISDNKRTKPKMKFNPFILFIIFLLSFLGCFILYMVSANVDENFLQDEFKSSSSANKNDDSSEAFADTSGSEADEQLQSENTTVSNPVAQSDAVDESYLKDAFFVADTSFLKAASIGRITNIVGNEALNALNVNDTKIDSSNGTITALEILKLKNPKCVYVMLGNDLGSDSVDEMTTSYSTFISSLKASLPQCKIYIMSIPPVYADNETLTNEMINDYNSRLLAIANSNNVYCIDTNTSLKSNTGTLNEAYYNQEANSLNDAGYGAICDCILTHTVK